MAKSKLPKERDLLAPVRGPVFSVRFIVAVALMVLGIAWIAYYYLVVRVDPTVLPAPKAGSPAFMADLKNWNYLIGFGALMIGLMVAAHPDTPLGRGRGVVVGMLGCFLIGLLWICTFYVISDNVSRVAIFNDLGQYNLLVGIAFMAVGFTFATRWE
ncbi:cell division protein CrgA [Nocardioides sp. KIGAM211]|uniref:Cell division protein CrgA n=1 Tax=Nocardioides luti TaxID=2761101 RepID=A0A7X0RGJ7_9ACTN|nr:cell division protein CrgA [Nocardioides luti]